MSLIGAAAASIISAKATEGAKSVLVQAGVPVVAGLAGDFLTKQGKERQALLAYYKQQAQGIDPAILKQQVSQAETDAMAKQRASEQQVALRGGVSNVEEGTSGSKMNFLLQQQELSRRLAREQRALKYGELRDYDMQQRNLGMKGLAAEEERRQTEFTDAAGMLLKADIGSGKIDQSAAEVPSLTADMTEKQKRDALAKTATIFGEG